MTEAEALAAVRDGSDVGLGHLLAACRPRAVGVAYSITHDWNTAEEVVAEASLKACRFIDRYDPDRPFGPWFLKIVANEALQLVRRSKRADRLHARLVREEDRPVDPVELAEANDLRRQVADAVSELPEDERAAVTLRYLQDLDEKTVAETLGWPVGTVKTRLRRARLRLRGKLLAVLVAAIALLLAAAVAVATGVLNQAIHLVPPAVWRQHFAAQHHGQTGKGSAPPGQAGTLAEVEQNAGFHVHTLSGIAGAEFTNGTWTTVTFPDGTREPEAVLNYRIGDTMVAVVELKDRNPSAPYEVPSGGTWKVETIDGAQYLVGADRFGRVNVIQFKTVDGVIFSVNFYGPAYPNIAGPGGADPQLATDVVRHL